MLPVIPLSSSDSRWKEKKLRRSFDLTEAGAEDLSRRNAAAAAEDGRDDPRYAGSSPYYRGLTDSRLYLTRLRSASLSPDQRSVDSAISISTVLSKIHDLGFSCFKTDGEQNLAADSSTAVHSVVDVSGMNGVGSVVEMREGIEDSSYGASPRVLGELESPESVITSDSGDSMVRKPMRERVETIPSLTNANADAARNEKPMRESVEIVPSSTDGNGNANSNAKADVAKREKPVRECVTMIPSSTNSNAGGEAAMKVKEFVWASKYRPQALKDFICNRDKAELLQSQVIRREYSHFIFEGPPGVGKKTMVWALLREAFGPEKLEIKEELKEFKLKGEVLGSIKVNVRSSPRHVEINLSELRGYEKHIIISFVEESHTEARTRDFASGKVVVLYQADKLSSDAQHYINWILGRYSGSTKIVFCCSDVSKLEPLRRVCTHIQLLPASKDEIIKVLEYIAEKEGIELPHHLAEKIAENSKQNLRQAIRSFEASWQSNNPFKEGLTILTGWEEDIAFIAKSIIDEQSPKQLYIIRGKLQHLIEHNISPDFIFRTLVEELKIHSDAQFQSKIDALYLEYNSLSLRCSRQELSRRNTDPARKNVQQFMKIEEFTAKFMSIYKSNIKKF